VRQAKLVDSYRLKSDMGNA